MSEQRAQPKGPIPYVFSAKSANKHMDWIAKVFQGTKDMVMADPKDADKVMHAAMQVNGGPLYFSDRLGEYGAPPEDHPASLATHLYLGYSTVEEAQDAWDAAVKHKAKVRMAFEKQFWGSMYGVVEDHFGTVWAISAQCSDKQEKEEEKEEKTPLRTKKSPRKRTPNAPSGKKSSNKSAKKRTKTSKKT